MNLCTVCQQFCPELTPEDEARINEGMSVGVVNDDEEKIMHSSWEEFAASLNQDCPICWSLWRLLRSSPLATPDKEKHDDFQSWVSRARALSFGYFLEVKLPGREISKNYASFDICKTTEKRFLETERCHPIPDIHTPESIAKLIHSWSDDCLQKHSKCKRRGTNNSTIPTRLLDVGDTYSDQWSIIETKGNVKYRTYVALSHRWAENTPKLLKNGGDYQLQRLYQNSQLPRDYQDIMSICRALSIRYLWIDSLCIFQDSADDFHSEAGTMAHIYQNAFLTLSICWDYSAASLLRSIRPRTIPRRPPAEFLGSRNRNSRPHSGDYAFVEDFCSFEIDVAEALINRRGWVLQERFLSPRIAYLGNEQIYWECHSHIASEVAPQGFSSFGKRNEHAGDIDERRHLSWSSLVEIYTNCTLTKKEDKLIAISGLARSLSESSGDTYFSGLWIEYWIPDLLWQPISGAIKTSHREYQSGDILEAPSWSWVGFPGPVTMRSFSRSSVCPSSILPCFNMGGSSPLAMLTEWILNPTGGDPFTSFRGASLRLNCFLIPINFNDNHELRQTYLEKDWRDFSCFEDEEDRVGCFSDLRLRFCPDDEIERSRITRFSVSFSRPFDPDPQLQCFSVPLRLDGSRSSSTIFKSPVRGLVIQETSKNEDRKFTRIGSFLARTRDGFGLGAVITKTIAKSDFGVGMESKTVEEEAFESRLSQYAAAQTSAPEFLTADGWVKLSWSSIPWFSQALWTKVHLV